MKSLNRQNILAVDDNVVSLKILTDILSPEYSVKVAQSGKEAIGMAQKSPPDLILLDIMMPVMDGFETCYQLKQDVVTQPIPVMFITGRGDPESEERGLRLGAVDYIQKPFIPSVVLARISNQLELKALRDGLEQRVQARTEELELNKQTTIFGMALLAEYRDKETGGHIWRTTEYVRVLAQAVARRDSSVFSPREIELISESAALHDIGKVGIPDSILKKPGPLTKEEFEIVKRHPLWGGEILEQVEGKLGNTSFLHFAKEIVLCHHEKWDGSGYPHGLKGDQVPLSASLTAIADVYDALISLRVYKKALSHSAAMDVILRGDGRTSPSHFDPLVLQAFQDSADELYQVYERIGD